MGTLYHTDSAVDGQEVTAATVTTPDGQLDDAIATVNANNWVTPARLNASVAGNGLVGGGGSALAVNPDGVTLDINADALRVKPAGIGAAQVSPSDFAWNTLVPDTFNLRKPVLAQEHGALLWYPRTQATLDAAVALILNDAANPFGGGNTLRMLGSGAWIITGKYIDCRRMGIKAGDKVTAAMAFMSDNVVGNNWGLQLQGTDSTGLANVGSLVSNGGFVQATGALQTFKTATLTVAAGTAYIRIQAIRQATGVYDGNIYAYWANKGGLVSDFPTIGDISDYLQEINDARGNYSSLDLRLSSTVGIAAGRNYLQSYNNKTALNKLGIASQIKMGLLGDSWVQNAMIRPVLRAALQAIWGNGGLGWIEAAVNTQSGTLDDGYTWTRVGTWDSPDKDINTSALAVGPAGADATTFDIATPAKLSVTYTANTITIHHWLQPNGGSYEWQITYNGTASGWTTVATANGTEAHGSTVITTPGVAFPTLLEVRAKVAGTAGIRLLGTEWIKSGINLVWYPLGHNSTTSALWVSMDSTKWQANIAALNLDIIGIILATNDKTNNVVPADFTANLTTLCGRIRTALPYIDIYFISPGNNSETGKSYTMADYDGAIRTAAAANRAGYINLYSYLDISADNQARGVTTATDGRHLLAPGGRLATSIITDFLRVGP